MRYERIITHRSNVSCCSWRAAVYEFYAYGVHCLVTQLHNVHETSRSAGRLRYVPASNGASGVECEMRNMVETRERIVATLFPASIFVLCFGMAAASAAVHNLPVDRSTSVMGVKIACTGIGRREENETRWRYYPVKLEAVGGYGQHLEDEEITLQSPNHAEPLHIKCNAPWVLMRLEPGRYQATVSLPNAPAQQVSFAVPREGQLDVIVQFPGLMTGQERKHGITRG